jgi:hypothetical protein
VTARVRLALRLSPAAGTDQARPPDPFSPPPSIHRTRNNRARSAAVRCLACGWRSGPGGLRGARPRATRTATGRTQTTAPHPTPGVPRGPWTCGAPAKRSALRPATASKPGPEANGAPGSRQALGDLPGRPGASRRKRAGRWAPAGRRPDDEARGQETPRLPSSRRSCRSPVHATARSSPRVPSPPAISM